MKQKVAYCIDPFGYQRIPTREVCIGNVAIGGHNPIVLQSMTTTDSMDVQATVEQSVRMIKAGCELVRITAPSKREAEKLAEIRKELSILGYSTPLVADIHFTPNAAEIAADYVEKVRVNPGNYADKKKFEHIEYTDIAYQSELERIRERFKPLVKKCKRLGRAMRIGTNHGSLSDRILSRYGDTPQGMVESAMEFVRICEEEDYYDLVISMKASNAQVMVQAYRLLMEQMRTNGPIYPLHLGVTEAGDGEDGRIKSAVGIGALMEDGIGDTIRVSLTEEPEAEIPVARKLAERYKNRTEKHGETLALGFDPHTYQRRASHVVSNIGAKQVPCVITDLASKEIITPRTFFGAGYSYSVPLDKWHIGDMASDFIAIGDHQLNFEIPGTLNIIQNATTWQKNPSKERHHPLWKIHEVQTTSTFHPELNFLELTSSEFFDSIEALEFINDHFVLVLRCNEEFSTPDFRRVQSLLFTQKLSIPVVLKRHYNIEDIETFQLYSATDMGVMLLDGFGDGVWLDAPHIPLVQKVSTSFGILQATRTRISKTEYISCPSCGRTLFDLQETTAKIRTRTSHLKGIKIGIMGCIVNGPGEMADADYGYVGTGPGKITLYKEKSVVEKNIPEDEAVDALINLIKSHGDWKEEKEVNYS